MKFLSCNVPSYLALLRLLLVPKIVSVTTMKIVVQRVKSASVKVNVNQNPAPVSAIGPGILALVGLHAEDTISDLEWCAKRLLAVKLWENDSGASWRQVREFCIVVAFLLLMHHHNILPSCKCSIFSSAETAHQTKRI